MSKNKHGDLFNISLTEIIIILFFVLLLYAFYSIDKVNIEKADLGKKVESLIKEKAELEAAEETYIEIINASDDPTSLGPINVELTIQNNELKREIADLEEEIDRLSPKDEPEDSLEDFPINQPGDSLIAGNCIDKNFWRQCAEWAWPSASEPPYEYLFDIGMCSSGDIVVIESAWKEKREMDFILVEGATAITNQMYINRNEIKSFISLIHDESLDFKEGQTQHVARLINLESIDTDFSRNPRLTIQDHMKFDPFTMGTKKYKEIKERFPKNACDVFKGIKSAKDDITQESPKDSFEVNTKPNKPVSSKASFLWDNNIACNRSAGKRNNEFNAIFNILVTDRGRVIVQDFSFDKISTNNRLLVMDAKASMEKQRKNIKPALNSKNPEDSKIVLQIKFPKDVCR